MSDTHARSACCSATDEALIAKASREQGYYQICDGDFARLVELAREAVQASTQWIHGIPSVEAVEAHERAHRSKRDRQYPGTISVSRIKRSGLREEYEEATVDTEDIGRCGEWLCLVRYECFDAVLPRIVSLRVVNGEILTSAGFTMWLPLADCRWAAEARYLPVTWEGLPVSSE